MSFGGNVIDQFVDHLDDGVVQPCARPGCERLGDQAAQSAVRLAVQAEEAVDDLVP